MAAQPPPFEDPRKLLDRHGLRPKRGYSQNFLVSRHAVEAIARAAVPQPGERVIELGPGLGTLTAELLRAGASVLAFERDPQMLQVLQAELGACDLVLRRQDAASADYTELAAEFGTKLCVVGNLPYAITGAILRNLVMQRSALSRVVVMVQREVRDRLQAAPGSAEYGALTVFTSAAFEIETLIKVSPNAFYPPPKVHSAVVKLAPRATPLAEETPAFQRVVRAAFQGRRKTLRNAVGAAYGNAIAERALAEAGIDPIRRGETLSVAEFAELAEAAARAEAAGEGGDDAAD
jgi:16S rRNA (adenine1518-N6/adenine1519-N6)-dimethyltransferase